MSLPPHYTPGRYRPIKVTIEGAPLYAVQAPGKQLVGRPDTYTTRPAAAAAADKFNTIRETMAPRKGRKSHKETT